MSDKDDIRAQPLSEAPLPSSFDGDEEFYGQRPIQRFVNKLKAEPLIPLGCLLTVAAFANAYRAMRKGDHNQVQRMFRARVLAQGFTVLAMVAGGIYYGNERHQERELWKIEQKRKDEEKRMRWIQELEARDAEEKALRERYARKRSRRAEQLEEEKAALAKEEAESKSMLSSLGGWVGVGSGGGGGGGGGGASAAAAAAAKKEVEVVEELQAEITAEAKAKAEKASEEATAAKPGKSTSSLNTLGALFSKKGSKSGEDSEEKK